MAVKLRQDAIISLGMLPVSELWFSLQTRSWASLDIERAPWIKKFNFRAVAFKTLGQKACLGKK